MKNNIACTHFFILSKRIEKIYLNICEKYELNKLIESKYFMPEEWLCLARISDVVTNLPIEGRKSIRNRWIKGGNKIILHPFSNYFSEEYVIYSIDVISQAKYFVFLYENPS